MNTQPVENKITSLSIPLQVHSIFHTIQGEGPFCGMPAVFVRLAGCNLQCPMCDTDYTSQRKDMFPHEVLEEIESKRNPRTRLIVITGGEPFRQDIGRLIKLLVDIELFVQIETNGTLPPPLINSLDVLIWNTNTLQKSGAYIVCAPKTGSINKYIKLFACALKYVVTAGLINEKDGLPLTVLGHSASPMVARPPTGWSRPVYVQPAETYHEHNDPYSNHMQDVLKTADNQSAAVQSCLKFGYILQLQVHKIINLE